MLCLLGVVISASALPLKAGAGLWLLFWSQQRSPAAGGSKMLSLLPACSCLCCGDEHLHLHLNELWELLGLTCQKEEEKRWRFF